MLSHYSSEFLALALVHLVAVLAPGVDFAITVRQSMRHGRRAGSYTALGIGCGMSVHIVYTLLGLSALLHSSPWLMRLAQWVGCAYLLYLSVGLLRSQPHRSELADAQPEHSAETSAWACWRLGFFTNATNPKATLFFLAVFSTLVQPSTPLWIQSLYGLWMCLINALWFTLVAWLFSSQTIRQRFLRQGHKIDRGMGVLLLALSLRLLL